MAYLPLPESVPENAAFVKIYQRNVEKKFFRRLFAKRNEALTEGKAYQRFAGCGLLTPKLLFYGVEGQGTGERGIVAVEKLQGETAQEYLERTDDFGLLKKLTCLLGVIHKKGFSHGDVNFYNFLLCQGEIFIIDLARVKRLNGKRRTRDLITFFAKTNLLGVGLDRQRELLSSYEAAAGCNLGEKAEYLLGRAKEKATDFEGTRWVRPD